MSCAASSFYCFSKRICGDFKLKLQKRPDPMGTRLSHRSHCIGSGSISPVVEALEPRLVQSVTSLEAGILTIEGDSSAPNQVVVHIVAQSGAAFVFVNHHHSIVPLSQLTFISVMGGEQSDSIIIDGDGLVDSTVEALGGNDSIFISADGNSSVEAGSGDDQVNTGAGGDVIAGGAGDDLINAGGGNDRIAGGSGNDRIDGGSADDMVNGGEGTDSVLYDVPADSFPDMGAEDSLLRADFAARSPAVLPGGPSAPNIPHQSSDPIVSWLSISDSGAAQPDYPVRIRASIAQQLLEGGWAAYINSVVLPQINWGCRRFVLWLPFGCDGDPLPYRFDQPLIDKQLGLAWLTDSFIRDWKRLIDHQAAINQPIEVIYYQGGINLSPTLRAEQDPVVLAKQLNESARYAIDAGMTIALDADAIAPDDSDAARFAQLLSTNGTKVYLEARPQSNTWTKDFPIISIDKWWRESDPDANPAMKVAGMVSTSSLTGEIIRFVTFPGGAVPYFPSTWQTAGATEVLSHGFSVAIDVQTAIEDHTSRSWFEGQMNH